MLKNNTSTWTRKIFSPKLRRIKNVMLTDVKIGPKDSRWYRSLVLQKIDLQVVNNIFLSFLQISTLYGRLGGMLLSRGNDHHDQGGQSNTVHTYDGSNNASYNDTNHHSNNASDHGSNHTKVGTSANSADSRAVLSTTLHLHADLPMLLLSESKHLRQSPVGTTLSHHRQLWNSNICLLRDCDGYVNWRIADSWIPLSKNQIDIDKWLWPEKCLHQFFQNGE